MSLVNWGGEVEGGGGGGCCFFFFFQAEDGIRDYDVTGVQTCALPISFYYVEYGIAQLGALQMWLKYRENPDEALDAYKCGLSLGGSKPLPQLFESAGLKFDFTADMVTELMATVEAELDKHA